MAAEVILFGEFTTPVDCNMIRCHPFVMLPAALDRLQHPCPGVPMGEATATPQQQRERPFGGRGESDLRAKKPARKTVTWSPPEAGWIKLNCDGAMYRGRAGCGYVIRDEAGAILAAGCCATPELSVIDAELRGMWEGLKAAVEVSERTEGGKKIWIEGDCMNMIEAFKKGFGSYLRDSGVAKEIMGLRDHFTEWRATHVYREGNKAADWLAGRGKFSPRPLHWTSDFPRELVMLAQRDLKESYVREK